MVRAMLQTNKYENGVHLEDQHSDAAPAQNTCSEGMALRVMPGTTDPLHIVDRGCMDQRRSILSDGVASLVPQRNQKMIMVQIPDGTWTSVPRTGVLSRMLKLMLCQCCLIMRTDF